MALKTIAEAIADRDDAAMRRDNDRVDAAEKALKKLGKPTIEGAEVRERIFAAPQDCAFTELACESCVDTPLVEIGHTLLCPCCGRSFAHVPGAGQGPVTPETLARVTAPAKTAREDSEK